MSSPSQQQKNPKIFNKYSVSIWKRGSPVLGPGLQELVLVCIWPVPHQRLLLQILNPSPPFSLCSKGPGPGLSCPDDTELPSPACADLFKDPPQVAGPCQQHVHPQVHFTCLGKCLCAELHPLLTVDVCKICSDAPCSMPAAGSLWLLTLPLSHSPFCQSCERFVSFTELFLNPAHGFIDFLYY